MFRMIIAGSVFLAPVLFAQNGAITGSVLDTDREPISKAAIQIRNEASGATLSTTSAADGSYTVANVPAGNYTITALVPGMLPYSRPKITVAADQTERLNLQLADVNSNTAGEDRQFYANLWNPKVQTGPTPRAGDGKPDLSGVWRPGLPGAASAPNPLPWAEAKSKEWRENNLRDFPQSRCLPGGMDVATVVTPIKFIQTPKLIVILFDEGDLPRQIFVDGRSHPKEYPLPAWAGHSIGRWEGDTLVVDSRGFNDKSWIGSPYYPHTDQLHMIERIHRSDLGHLDIQTTYEDSGAFVKPWTFKKTYLLAPSGEDVEEYICNENNRDLIHYVGK